MAEPARGLSSTLVLTSGSVLGQLVVVSSMPIITRLYSPAEMGLYAMFTALIGVFATISALHYELAIPLPKSELHARLSVHLSFTVALATGFVFFGVLMILSDPLLKWIGAPELGPLTGIMPVSLIATGITTILIYRSLRAKTYRVNASAKLIQGIIQSAAQIGYGLAGVGVRGLIYGLVIGQCGAMYTLAHGKKWREIFQWRSSHRLKIAALTKKYRNFPLISAPSSLLNAIVVQAPVLLLAAWFDSRVVGLYALGFRILQMPLMILGNAMSQVLFATAAEAHRAGTLSLVVGNTWRPQMIFAMHSFLPLTFIAPEVFEVAFGVEWREAGVYTQYLMPWLMALFISTTLSILVSVLEKQKQEFLFQIGYLGIVVVALSLGYLSGSEHITMIALGAGGGLILTGKIIWLLRIANVKLASQARWLALETLYVAGIAAIILGLKSIMSSDVFIVVITGMLILGVHGINHFRRRVYAF